MALALLSILNDIAVWGQRVVRNAWTPTKLTSTREIFLFRRENIDFVQQLVRVKGAILRDNPSWRASSNSKEHVYWREQGEVQNLTLQAFETIEWL